MRHSRLPVLWCHLFTFLWGWMQSITCFSKRSKQMIRLRQQSFSKVLNLLDMYWTIFFLWPSNFGQVDSHFLSGCRYGCSIRGFVLSGCTRHGGIWGQSLLRLSEGVCLNQKGCLEQNVWMCLGHFRERMISAINTGNGIYKSWDFRWFQQHPSMLDTYVADIRDFP